MNTNPEKDPVLSSVEQMSRHREFIIDSALKHIVQAVPEVVDAQTTQAVAAQEPTNRYPQNVVSMDMRQRHQESERAEQASMLDYSRDVIDALYEDKHAA